LTESAIGQAFGPARPRFAAKLTHLENVALASKHSGSSGCWPDEKMLRERLF